MSRYASQRQRCEPSERWEQRKVLFTASEHFIDEQIRPLVLFSMPLQERAREVGAAERTLYRHVQRFAQQGMRGLCTTDPAPRGLRIPSAIRKAVIALKAEHPSLHLCDFSTICSTLTNGSKSSVCSR